MLRWVLTTKKLMDPEIVEMVRFLDPEIVEKGDKSLILKNLNSSVVSLAQLVPPSVALPVPLVFITI